MCTYKKHKAQRSIVIWLGYQNRLIDPLEIWAGSCNGLLAVKILGEQAQQGVGWMEELKEFAHGVQIPYNFTGKFNRKRLPVRFVEPPSICRLYPRGPAADSYVVEL